MSDTESLPLWIDEMRGYNFNFNVAARHRVNGADDIAEPFLGKSCGAWRAAVMARGMRRGSYGLRLLWRAVVMART